jgi:hypothetical protein
LPYGNFIEIEGENITAIQSMAMRLNLNPRAAIAKSYSTLFDIARRTLGLTFTDLTFVNFEVITVLPEHLQVQPADQPLVPKHD